MDENTDVDETTEALREAAATRVRVTLEWISNTLREHWRAVALDEAIHELEEIAAQTGRAYSPADRVPDGPGQWWHCSPAPLRSGVDCGETPRRACECPDGGSHDHYVRGATCRHRGPWMVDPQCISETASTLRWRPAPSYEIQGSGYAPDPFEWPTDGVRDIYDPRETR